MSKIILFIFFFICVCSSEININFAGLLSGVSGSSSSSPSPSTSAPAPALVSRDVDYVLDGKTYQGYVSFLNTPASKPAVLVVHDWDGLDAYEKGRADEWARLGYLGFAVDVFGKGVRPQAIPDRISNISVYSNPTAARARIVQNINYVQSLPGVDTSKTAVTGYCFGGMMSLEAARSGANIQAAISFHGGLTSSQPVQRGQVRASLLALHGARDASIPDAAVIAFQNEMRNASVYYNFVAFSEAVHAFTVPSNATAGNAIYNRDADIKSHRLARQFLVDVWQGLN